MDFLENSKVLKNVSKNLASTKNICSGTPSEKMKLESSVVQVSYADWSSSVKVNIQLYTSKQSSGVHSCCVQHFLSALEISVNYKSLRLRLSITKLGYKA